MTSRDSPEDLRELERTVMRWLAEGTMHPLPQPGSPWGKYRIEALLEEGGMGRVYRAWDVSLRRSVALKCLRTEDPRAVERLIQEARAQARVSHQHVCRVYEVGDVGGRPYIAMQLIEGRTLKEAAGAMTLEQKVRAIMQVAFGVEAAHNLGLVHRDLKPDNVLIERPESGELRPFLVDFGIARETDDPHLTRTGMVVGSLPYMAPERLEGAPIDLRMDIWGLGATLYELFAADPPFAGASEPELLRQILREEVVPLARIVPEIPRDLEAVIMKCLERDPDRRYASAGDLARDLERFLAGKPVSARPAGWPRRLAKRLVQERNRILAALLALTLAAGFGYILLAGRPTPARRGALSPEGLRSQVEEIESKLRVAYLLPFHDTRPERRDARAHLLRLESQVEGLSGEMEGVGRTALGRGFLALGDPDRAYRHLSTAWSEGYRAPEAAYEMGMALGLKYRQEAAAAERIEDPGQRAARLRLADQRYRLPACVYLRAERRVRDVPRPWGGALLAFYSRRYADALREAQALLALDPFFFEAARLIGDIHRTQADDLRDRGEYAVALAEYAEAGRAYAAASQIARSDPETLTAECARARAVVETERALGSPLSGSVAYAHDACVRAALVNGISPQEVDSPEEWGRGPRRRTLYQPMP